MLKSNLFDVFHSIFSVNNLSVTVPLYKMDRRIIEDESNSKN